MALGLGTDISLLGDVIAGRIAGEDLTPGMVTIDPDDDLVYMASAAASTYPSRNPAIGYCAFNVNEGMEVSPFREGEVHDDDDLGLTASEAVYLSETEGEVTGTAPTTSGSIVQIVGQALDDRSFNLNILLPYDTNA